MSPSPGIEAAIKERRYSPRQPWSVQIRAELLHPFGPSEPLGDEGVWLEGSTSDICRGGLGILSDRLFPPNSILRCEVVLAEEKLGIPTLAQVRWFNGIEGRRKYKIGLQFVL